MSDVSLDEALVKCERALKKIADVPALQLTALRDVSTCIKISKNEFFLKDGDDPRNAGFVISGLFRYFYIGIDGKEHTKNFAFENRLLLSYGAFLRKQPSKLYIQALEDSEILHFDYSYLYTLAEKDTDWLKALLILSEDGYVQKESRESELLIYDAPTRYLNFCRDYPNLEKRIKQYHIASFLGIAPEALSRIRTNLKN